MDKLNSKVQNIEKAVKLPDMHNHTIWCRHSQNSMEKLFSNQKYYGGFIAINEHMPLPKELHNNIYKKFTGVKGVIRSQDDIRRISRQAMIIEDINGFFHEWKISSNYYSNPNVVIGFEVDYIKGLEEKTQEIISDIQDSANNIGVVVNHFSLAAHYYKGEMLYTPETTKKILEIEGFDKFVKGYFSGLIDGMQGAIKGFKPDFVCHPGVIHYLINNGVHESTMENEHNRDIYYKEYLKLLDVAKRENIAVEINTGGYDRKFYYNKLNDMKDCMGCDMPNPYMPDYIMQKAIEKGVKLVVGSDCHAAGEEFRYFDKIHDKLISMGATEVYMIKNREKIPIKL